MEKEKKLKLIGAAMCVPALIMAIYLLAHMSVILVSALSALSAASAVYGIKLIRGKSLDEVKNDLMEDINDLRDKE